MGQVGKLAVWFMQLFRKHSSSQNFPTVLVFLGDCEKFQVFLLGKDIFFDVQSECNSRLLVSLTGNCSFSGERARI